MAEAVRTGQLQAVGESFDPWKVLEDEVKGVDDDYSPDEFYTKATNKHDHSSTPYSVRVDPTTSAQISALIASGKIPHYKTPSDFFRDALVHRLHYLVYRMDLGTDEMREMLSRTREQARLDMLASQVADIEKMIQTAQDGMNNAMLKGDVFMLDQIREGLERQVENLREPYRGKVVGMISTLNSRSGG